MLPKRRVQVSSWEGLVPAHWWVEVGLILLVGRVVLGLKPNNQHRSVYTGADSCWEGPGLGGSLQEAWSQWVLPRTTAASVPVPAVSHSQPHCHGRPAHTRSDVWFRLLWGYCFSPGSWCVPDLLCASKRGMPVGFLQSGSNGLQSQILWGSVCHRQTSRLGSLMWGSELSLLWENFCMQCSYFPVCWSPTERVRDLVLLPSHPSYCLDVASLSLDVGYLFW